MRRIILTQGRFALIDNDDYKSLSKVKWYAHLQKTRYKTYYAVRTERRKLIYMHRVILNASKGTVVDHIDGDGLNNARSNLRLCSPSENCRNKRKQSNNKSGFIGVSWHKASKKWRATLTHDKKSISLGIFDSAVDAYCAYVSACKKYHGDFINNSKLQ